MRARTLRTANRDEKNRDAKSQRAKLNLSLAAQYFAFISSCTYPPVAFVFVHIVYETTPSCAGLATPEDVRLSFCIYLGVLSLQYHPNHIKGLVLLGDINVNHLKNLEAAEEVSPAD